MKYTVLLTVHEPDQSAFLGEYEANGPDDALDELAKDKGEESWASWSKAPKDEVVVIGSDGSRVLR